MASTQQAYRPQTRPKGASPGAKDTRSSIQSQAGGARECIVGASGSGRESANDDRRGLGWGWSRGEGGAQRSAALDAARARNGIAMRAADAHGLRQTDVRTELRRWRGVDAVIRSRRLDALFVGLWLLLVVAGG